MSLDALDPILSERELAAWLHTSRPTLQRQRSDGSGPEFVQLSERRIGYRKSAVERWLASRTTNRIGDHDGHERHESLPAANISGYPNSSSVASINPLRLERGQSKLGVSHD